MVGSSTAEQESRQEDIARGDQQAGKEEDHS
jgi:hypothetical protein